ncbi:hypothetical protein AMTR_s00089p00115940 [Amborella trichopoda]|uniref:Retrotransposon gag domain-containing protein n=1 Tax=Amborella trichopoda TaxID=13333 RepID=W1P2P5_AMBTC|nr:hypothetical protein AMTR_s00089p00115940 [Amborella trichopoda]
MEALDVRIAPSRSEVFSGKISKLIQSTTILEYQKEFHSLSDRVRGLSEGYLINLYFSLLKEEIQLDVQKLQSTTLPEVFSLAKIHEEEMNVKKKVEFRKPHQGCGSRHSSKPIPTIRKLTPAEA